MSSVIELFLSNKSQVGSSRPSTASRLRWRLHSNGFIACLEFNKNGSNACARTDQCWGTSKNVRNRGVSDVAAWLRTGGDDDPLTTIDRCRYVDFSLESDAEFYPCLKRLCASSRS